MAAAASYPFAVTIRNAIETTPHQVSQGVFEGNYRKVLYWFWSGTYYAGNGFAGLYKVYFYKTFPWMFTVT